jgi:hypothetical protein
MPESPQFQAVCTRGAPAPGFDPAFLDVVLTATGLLLVPAAGERLEIPFDAIDRLRFGYETSRMGGRFYWMRVWTHRDRDPLVLLVAGRDTSPGYEAVARAAAAAVAGRRGIGSVEGGLGWGGALFLPLLFLPFFALGSWFSVLGFLEGQPLPFVIGLPTVVLSIGGIFGYGFLRLWCPRRLKRLDDLDPFVSKEKRPWLF